MPTVEKVVNFTYVDVKSVKLRKLNNDTIIPVDFDRVVGSANIWKAKGRTPGITYDCIELIGNNGTLAYIKDIEIDDLIVNLYFKYNIVDSEISFEISEVPLDIDDQYIGDYGHNHSYVIDDYGDLTNPKHFDNEGTLDEIKDEGTHRIITNSLTVTTDILFNHTLYNIQNAKMLLNTLTTYFTGNNLVLGCLYKDGTDYYYLIKNSQPTGRNRLIKLTQELVDDYEATKVFQLIEVFDNLVICTGKNIYTYNVAEANYQADSIDEVHSSRHDKSLIYQNQAFDLSTISPGLRSSMGDTISTEVPESQFAYFLPMDIDYCRKFFAIKLNSYNCYEFHTGNLLAGYNITDDNQIHHIHDGESTGKSTLSYEEFKGKVAVEGTEYSDEGKPSLVNDTSPYTNYDSYDDTNVNLLNDVGKLERHLICELYLNLKHAINNVTGHGDLLGKFSHFRLLESGICKITESMSGDLILVIYTNVMTNLRKFIFKLGLSTLTPMKKSDFDLESFYIQLSNDTLSVYYKSNYNYTKVVNLAGSDIITRGLLMLSNEVPDLEYVRMYYKGTEMKVDHSLELNEDEVINEE